MGDGPADLTRSTAEGVGGLLPGDMLITFLKTKTWNQSRAASKAAALFEDRPKAATIFIRNNLNDQFEVIGIHFD